MIDAVILVIECVVAVLSPFVLHFRTILVVYVEKYAILYVESGGSDLVVDLYAVMLCGCVFGWFGSNDAVVYFVQYSIEVLYTNYCVWNR